MISIDGTKNKDASNTFKWEFYIPPPVPTFDSVTLNHTGEKTTNYDQSFNVIVSGRWDTDFGPVNSLVLSDKLYLLDFMESPDVSNNWQFATRVYPYSSINDVPLANRQSSPTLVSDGNPVNNSTFGGGYCDSSAHKSTAARSRLWSGFSVHSASHLEPVGLG